MRHACDTCDKFRVRRRVAIGRAVEATIGERRGGDTSTGEQSNPQNIAAWKGAETRQIAATKAGFGNAETYRQAKAVVDNGAPELVAAVDSGEVSVSAGAALAKLPKGEQASIVASGGGDVGKPPGAEDGYRWRGTLSPW